MKRRTLLTTTGAAASTFAAPAIAQGVRELKLVSSFRIDEFVLIGETIMEASNGRLKVKMFAGGELVGPFEVFDAVAEGLADMYFSSEYYWRDRSPAFQFFAAVPFGLTSEETYAWITRGGGQELWDELSAKFNLKPFPVHSSGVQMGGWYNKEMTSIESFNGLRMRMPGMGGEVMRRLGAIVINLPMREIIPALQSGALDAVEWVGPNSDFVLGFHEVAKYYYYPGFHEPASMNTLAVNKDVWESLSASEQKLIETAIAGSYARLRADLQVRNKNALAGLVEEHGVQLRKFDDQILRRLGEVSGEVVAEVGANDPFTQRVYEGYMQFHREIRPWTDISERAYLNARALDFPYGT